MKSLSKVLVISLFFFAVNACSTAEPEEFDAFDKKIEDAKSDGNTGKGQRPRP
ncbi:MAG: hypothetical protein ABJQ69_03625 [Ekhidna sp.]